jgi:signal transduction histidine kinase
MAYPLHVRSAPARTALLRALRLTLWIVPGAMALTGIAFTLFENFRHFTDPGWPWMTALGLIVMGMVGPVLSWFSLRWAIRAGEAYLVSEEQLARRNEQLAALNALAMATSSSLDIEKTLAEALEQIIQTLDAAAGMVFLQDLQNPNDHSKGTGLRLEAHRGISVTMAQKEAHLSPGHCLCGRAVANRQVLFAGDVGKDVRCTSDLCICEGFRSVACIPLEVKGQLVGLMQLASPRKSHFNESQGDFRLYETVRVFNVELEQKVNLRTRELEAARWALAEKARQLQRLLSESYRVQEDTQARIAHDMHDGVTQIIIGALYETQAARQALLDDPDRAGENLDRAQQLLSDVENEIRRVIYDLHPPVLDQMGLVVAMKRFATTYQSSIGIECQVQVAGQPRRLGRETEVAIYRIIQAALHNVSTHAHASHASVGFDFGSAALQVMIEDNGIGFDPDAVIKIPGEHLGLIGMKERAEGLGAEIRIESAPGEGTRILLHLPVPVYME